MKSLSHVRLSDPMDLPGSSISMRTKQNFFSILNVNFEARTLKILGIIRICNVGILFLQLRGQT